MTVKHVYRRQMKKYDLKKYDDEKYDDEKYDLQKCKINILNVNDYVFYLQFLIDVLIRL